MTCLPSKEGTLTAQRLRLWHRSCPLIAPAMPQTSPCAPSLPPPLFSLCSYVANMQFCQFPQLAAGLAEARISSFRFDHPMAIKSESERKGPFQMGNHNDEASESPLMHTACCSRPAQHPSLHSPPT